MQLPPGLLACDPTSVGMGRSRPRRRPPDPLVPWLASPSIYCAHVRSDTSVCLAGRQPAPGDGVSSRVHLPAHMIISSSLKASKYMQGLAPQESKNTWYSPHRSSRQGSILHPTLSAPTYYQKHSAPSLRFRCVLFFLSFLCGTGVPERVSLRVS